MIDVTEEIIARQPPESQAIIRALLAEIASLRAELDELRRSIQDKTSQNSSRPPSTQHPHAKPAPRKRKSKKKRGGQPGHKKHERPLLSTRECDDVQTLKPTECRRCGEGLSGSDSQPLRHQVWELPEIKPHVTEYRRHRLECACCGEMTCAELPPGVPQGQSGPRLVAFTGLLMAYFRQSKRRTAEFLSTLLGHRRNSNSDGSSQRDPRIALLPPFLRTSLCFPGMHSALDAEAGSVDNTSLPFFVEGILADILRPGNGIAGLTR